MPGKLIMVRHGESTWNRSNQFTGWEDVPLTETGLEEARSGGRLVAEAGLRPAAVHTSLLLRAIQTADALLEEAQLAWLPVRRSWRLNERHYGALQGLNKTETAEKYGEEQVTLWRRSYSVRPPQVEPSDPRHPARDPRYAAMPPELLPGGECLADVVDRVLPYWYDAVVPELAAGADVLLVAHGNSLRALVKHLENLDETAIMQLNIPTGIPRLYQLDQAFRPREVRYLGDAGLAQARAAAVANQSSTRGGA